MKQRISTQQKAPTLPASINTVTLKNNRATTKLISIIAISAVIAFIFIRLLYFVNSYPKCNEEVMPDTKERYLWLFDNTEKEMISCKYPLGNSAIEKYRYLYTYNNRFTYLIIEDSKLNGVTLEKVSLDTMVKKITGDITPSELNDLFWVGHINFKSKFCIDSSNSLKISPSTFANFQVDNSLHNKIFRGQVKQMSIENENGEIQYLLKYDRLQKTSIIFHKPKNILYIVIVNSFSDTSEISEAISKLQL